MFAHAAISMFLAKRAIQRGNKGTLALTIVIIAMVFVNLVFQPSIISGVVVMYNRQTIDYQYGHIVIEPRENELTIEHARDLTRKIERVPGIVGASSRIITGATFTRKGKFLGVSLYGIHPDEEREASRIHTRMKDGQYLSSGDRREIILGSYIAGQKDERKDLLPSLGGVDVGETISVTYDNGVTREYVVKGIFDTDSFGVDYTAFITTEEMESVLGARDQASQIVVRIPDSASTAIYRTRLQAYGVQETVKTWQDKTEGVIGDALESFEIINLIAMVVSLVIAIVVIFIVTFINTVSKQKQIGILKAIGIDQQIIIGSYVIQALFIWLCGIIVGGLLIFALTAYLTFFPLMFPEGPVSPAIEAELVIQGILSLLAVSFIAGYVPSWISVRKDILASIRG